MLRRLSISVGLLFNLVYFANCQIPFPGSCPDVNIVETFDLDRYMGTWYEYSKYLFFPELGQKCQQAVYKNEGNDTVSVVNTGVYIIVNRPHSVTGTAKVIAPGQLAVSFRSQKTDDANYLVLGTDYDNWVVVYSCRNITAYGHTKLLWILTRNRQPTEEAIAAAMEVIKNNKLSEIYLTKSKQTECPNINYHFENDNRVTETPSLFTTAEDQTTSDFSATSTERFIDTA